ncbi:uncharacterized protein LOC142632452 [Castanea sativa]|uniref:uncharacterized protein LOC142632452 n=1 Tax=Castanea sativa TaxID=21020 RepID=UPI003F649C61
MIDGLFNTEEAELIKTIPLSREATMDNQQNIVRLNQPADSLHQIAHISKVWLADYRAKQMDSDMPVQQNQRPRKHWKPPPAELFKINFDSAVFPHEKKIGIGVVIRDHRGLVITSCSKLVHQELCSDDIEATTAGWALAFALEIGVKRVVLEGDSLNVIKGLTKEKKLLVPMGLLIEDAKKLSYCFDELLYSHTERECNTLAHSMTKYAVGIPDFLVWMEDVPPQLLNVFQADLFGFFE